MVEAQGVCDAVDSGATWIFHQLTSFQSFSPYVE